MFDIGFTELLIVALVALIVVGPERLPSTVRAVGVWVGRIRRAVNGVKKEITDELRIEEMRQEAKAKQEELERQTESFTKPFSDSLRDEILSPSVAEEPNIAGPQNSAEAEVNTETKTVADPK